MNKISILISIILLVLPGTLLAQEQGDIINENLQYEHQRADENENKVRELTKQTGQMSTRLSDIEHDVRLLKGKILSQEKILNEIKKNEQKARKDHFALEKEKQRIILELSGLMQALWPVHLQNVRARFKGVESWDMFDRRFNWLADIYDATNGKLTEARINSERIIANLERQRLLEKEAETQLARSEERRVGKECRL